VASLAKWLADHPEEIAFNSVRALADRAGANANTVVRLARAMGFPGYEACRQSVQDALRHRSGVYGQRAGALLRTDGDALMQQIRDSGHRNIDSVFSGDGQAAIVAAADLMLGARQVHVIGVRSCFAVADYMAYLARMAFENFGERAGAPGDIRDRVAATTPKDVVVSITFPHYSVETIAAHDLARRRGARTIAVTDGPGAPIAEGADVLLCPGMNGPQHLPSMLASFALAEALVTMMVARSDAAQGNIMRFEQRLLDSGAYRT
jgi:DNA-binding MurR/RpiR family transcriptional regulator